MSNRTISNRYFIPMVKVDEEKRLVYMRAASETTDHSGESMDYDKSKPNFEKWSNDAYTRSAGKSYGNIREMHGSIAAGKINEPLIFDDEAKTVDIVVYVSDDGSWQKVKDGVLTGASIGGSYEDIRFDPVLGVKRYVADLSEISLVDSPCNPDATIEVIKSNGTVELRKIGSSLVKEVTMKKSLKDLIDGMEKNLNNTLAKSFSHQDIEDRVRASIKCRLKENYPNEGGYSYGYDSYYYYGYFYVVDCYDDSIVIRGEFGENGAYYNIQVFYTIDDTGVVTLGEARIVHMVPEPCNDNDGDNEALERFMDKATSLMEKGVQLSEGSRGKMVKLFGGNEMTEQEKQEQEELQKAMSLVIKKFGTPEELEKFEKANLEKAKVKKDDMASADGKDDDVKKADDSTEEPDGDEVKKSAGAEDSLSKALGSIDKTMNTLLKFNESLQKRISDLEAQPSPVGPAVTAQDKSLGGAPMVKSEAPTNNIDSQIMLLKGVQDQTADMAAREAISKQIANLEMQKAYQNPIVFRG